MRTQHLGFLWTTKLLIRDSHAIELTANLFFFSFLQFKIVLLCFCFVLFCFFFLLIFQADTSFILFHFIVENLIWHIFLIIMIIIPCSGMFHDLLPALNLLVPNYTPGWRGALWDLSVLPKSTTQCPRPESRPNPDRSLLSRAHYTCNHRAGLNF